MRIPIRPAPLVALAGAVLTTAVALAGCGGDRSGTPVIGHPATPDATGRLTLTVHTSTAPGGPRFTEGFVPEVRVRAADGSTILPEEDHVDRAVFGRLAPGRYVVQAATRPCDANCGNLDPAQDECRRAMRLDRDLELTVHYRPGRPCLVDVPRSAG
jgi:hypothetical protein